MDIKEIKTFQVMRNINDLQKGFLRILEDIYKDETIFIKTVTKYFDDEDGVIESFTPLSEEKCAHIRKKVLDLGGDCMRAVQKELENE
tara:strand:+ start:40571 stop:40834 length:264 start_codon:yes stop_codon:yes gene_type:complete